MEEVNFGDLYSYQTKNGVVLPITNDIKKKVEEAFKGLFGEDFSTDSATPQGRMIEAISLLFCDVLRVCAVNANGFNPYQAVGSYLDNLGQMYGLARFDDESDSAYRRRIVESSSNGSGYAAAIRSALSRIDGVTSVSVLDNGNADPAMLPVNAPEGVRVRVEAHSVLICIGGTPQVTEGDGGYVQESVIEAIFNNISAGCGMQAVSDASRVVSETVDSNGVQKTIIFNKAKEVPISISVSVRDTMYTGVDIIGDTKTIIETFVKGDLTTRHISQEDIASAVASAGTGIICSEVVLTQNNLTVDSINVTPLQAISLADDAVTVEVI